MDLKDKMPNFRNVSLADYPELSGYSSMDIYDDFIGCGGLYLATKMIRKMNLKKGDIVLDLGCGFGTTSIFLTKMFDITVIAVDLWFQPTDLVYKINISGLPNKIIPLNLDITETIPFAKNYFDAIFCMNSLFLFGENRIFLRNLIDTLKVRGTFCIGSECFNKEPVFQNDKIPEEYNFKWKWNVWDSCYSKYHSPNWWKSLLTETDLLDITYCEELEDGKVLFEDFALNYYNYLSNKVLRLNAVVPQERIVDQIICGREDMVYQTLFVLLGNKR